MSATHRNRILVISSVVICNLFVWVLSGYFLAQSRRQNEHQAEVFTQNIATAIDQSLSGSIEKVDLAMRAVADALEQSAPDGGRPAKIETLLLSYPQRLPDLASMRVTDAAGVVIFGKGADPRTPVSYSRRPFFSALRDHPEAGLQVTPPMFGYFSHRWVIGFARRYVAADGRFAGVVTSAITLDHFTDLISRFNVGPGGGITLRGTDFAQIARYPKSPRGQTSEIGNTVVSPELKELVRSGLPQATYHTRTPIDGVERILTFHRLGALPMIATVGLASRDYLAEWRSDVANTCLLLGSFLLLSLVSAVAVLRAMHRIEEESSKLTRSEERYRSLFENAPFGIYQTTPEGRLTNSNPTILRMFGYQGAEQMNPVRTEPADSYYVHQEQRAAMLHRALAAPGYVQGEVLFRRIDGSHFTGNLHMRAVPGEGGKLLEGFVEDISSRKGAEAALQKSEWHFRLMAETVQEVFWLTAPADNALLYLSPAFEKIWGVSCAAVYANPRLWMEAILPEYLPQVRRDLEALYQGSAVQMEFRIRRPDGTLRWICDRGYPYRDASGAVTYITGVASDVTERKLADEALRVSESKFRIIFENEVYAICIFEVESQLILDVNEAHLAMYGYSREELCSGMRVLDLSAEPGKSELSIHSIARARTMFVPLKYHRKKDGTLFPVEIVGGAYLWNGRNVMFGMVHDITERVKAEKSLKKYAQRLIVQEEDLRKQVSMELHDDIGQELTALGLNLAHLGRHLPAGAGDELQSTLTDSRLLTKEISRTVRNLMVNLRPVQLEEYGLAGAIRSYADQYAQRSGLAVSLDISPRFPRLPAKLEIAFFRITQEALNNVAKYAAATVVTISLTSQDSRVRLRITDDGQGFEPREASLQPTGSGWGLAIMRERAELIGGSFRLTTQPGAGTSILVEVAEGGIAWQSPS